MDETIPFSQNTTFQEVNLRGAFMMQSCDLEMALLHIMLFCIVDVEENTVIKKGFKGMMLGEKIKKTIEVLQTYRSELFKDYESCFDELEGIKTVRNQMAHCKMLWDKNESDNPSFEFLEITKEKNEDEKFDPIKMSVESALIKLSEFRDVIIKITGLAATLKEDFRLKYPGILKPK
jgi:hypothetical protein